MKIKNIKNLIGTENNYHLFCNLLLLKVKVDTDKAIQIINTTGKRLWIPKSQLGIFEDRIYVTNFIYQRHPEFFEQFSSIKPHPDFKVVPTASTYGSGK